MHFLTSNRPELHCMQLDGDRIAPLPLSLRLSGTFPPLRGGTDCVSQRLLLRRLLLALLPTLGGNPLPAQLEKLGGPIQSHPLDGVGYA